MNIKKSVQKPDNSIFQNYSGNEKNCFKNWSCLKINFPELKIIY